MSHTGLQVRSLVLEVLSDASGKYKKDLLLQKLGEHSISPLDHQFMTEFINGVVRHSRTLSHVIKRYSHRPVTDGLIFNILQMGLYQLLFMDRIPAYAAIDTSVELAKRCHLCKEGKFINALLRTVQRETELLDSAVETPNVLPLPGGKCWDFKKNIFPNVRKDPYEYWAVVHSYPTSLVKKWNLQFGGKRCKELLVSGNCPPPIWIRPRRNEKKIKQTWTQEEIRFSEYGSLLRLEQSGNIEKLPGFQEGDWVVTGFCAYQVVQEMAPRPGMSVLDLCAAPGGKTVHIADLMQNEGKIVACDISPERLRLLENNAQKLGITCISSRVQDCTRLPEEFKERFDQVLVDVPCSNTAVLGKRVEARWRFNPEKLEELQKIQRAILHEAATAVKPGGSLVYSTCSLEPEENEETISHFLSEHPLFMVEGKMQILPLPPHLDGGTFCKLRHRATSE